MTSFKTIWEKQKRLVTSISLYSHIFFFSVTNLSNITLTALNLSSAFQQQQQQQQQQQKQNIILFNFEPVYFFFHSMKCLKHKSDHLANCYKQLKKCFNDIPRKT